MYGQDVLLYENPKRKRRRRRNPAGVATMRLPGPIRRWIPLSVGEILAATGGLAASTMIPITFVKDTSTNLRKFGKILVSLAAAAGAGVVSEGLFKGSGKAAMLGGVAGTGAMSLGMFTNVQIGGRRLIQGSRTPNLGESRSKQAESEGAGIQVSTT